MARFEMTSGTVSIMNFTSGEREHLVNVHVTLRSTAGLEYNEREVINEFARNDLLGESTAVGCMRAKSPTSSAACPMAVPILGSMP